MSESLTINRKFHVTKKRRGSKHLQDGVAPGKPTGRVPRITRLLALAHRCHRLIQDGTITNQSELAHYGQISTTRMTQIMWMDNLAPTSKKKSWSCPTPSKAATGSKKPRFARSLKRSIGNGNAKCVERSGTLNTLTRSSHEPFGSVGRKQTA